MSKIYLALIVLALIQLALLYYKLDISIAINITNNVSWWIIFIPVYVVIAIIAFFILILSSLSM